AWVPEELGGAGADLADGFAVLNVAGCSAVPVPLAETMLAGWLLAQGGIACPAGPMTVAPARPGDRLQLNDDGSLSGRARAVPFAREAQHVAVVATQGAGHIVALVKSASCQIVEGQSLARDPLDMIVFERAPAVAH